MNQPIPSRTIETTCCVVGGGPAGMMLAYLLARAGIRVTVIEKHNDFFRDFRGDTVHPSTLQLMYELGILQDFLRVPHQKLTSVNGRCGDFIFQAANLSRVPAHCKFVALMPQWDFLNFLSGRAKEFPGFELRMRHEALGLIEENGCITGVEVKTPDGALQIRAGLVVGCDGRHSVMRSAARLEVIESGVPIDVLWFRLTRHTDDPDQLFGNINYGKVLVLINRGDYFQAGLIVPKNSFEETKRQGLDAFRETLLRIAPWLGDRVRELRDWDQIKLLSVQINRLREWSRPGLICIGDAAHAMSPAGGVGINLAIQDAVATANLLAVPLREGRVSDALLAAVQKRREFPARATQFMQVNAHRMFQRVFQNPGTIHAPWQLKLAVRVPGLQHLMGRVVGIGVRPEHVRTMAAPRAANRGKSRALAFAVLAGAAVGIALLRANSGASSRRLLR